MRLSPRDLARSTTARFVGLHLLNSLVGSAIILLFVYHITETLLRNDLRDVLAREAQAVEFQFRTEGPASAAREVQRLLGSETRSAVILLADPRGRILAGNLEAWPATVPPSTQWRELRLFPLNSDRSQLVGVMATDLPGGYRLLTGYELTSVESLRDALATALLLALGVGVVFGLGGGALLARFINRRIVAIGYLAGRFAAGAHTERLKVEEGSREPFDRLSQALNSMLDRIEHLVEELRLTTDGLAHDLRSPLVRLRARGEQALAGAETPASQAAIEAMLKEADTLLRMLATMLEISRAEAGLGREMIASVDLAELARDVVEIYEPLAEERGVAIAYAGETRLIWPANRELLAQALSNLVDNALHHGSGLIAVEAQARGDGACLSVSDQGVGIPADRREEVLQRFSRLDPARGKEGAGLGLALVNAIARMHGGWLCLDGNQPGLRVTIELPADGSR